MSDGPLRRAAVLGHPVGHSLSPVLHRAAYAALGLDGWAYDAFDVTEEQLPAFVEGLDGTWAGLSLTMPLKQTVIPLLDHVVWDEWSHTGVLSLATDPVDPDNVYAAVGTYTNSWDPQNGAVLRSHDRGETWQRTMLPFKVGGNMPGRGMGERLQVDPNDNRVLYLGTESGNGLWRSRFSLRRCLALGRGR